MNRAILSQVSGRSAVAVAPYHSQALRRLLFFALANLAGGIVLLTLQIYWLLMYGVVLLEDFTLTVMISVLALNLLFALGLLALRLLQVERLMRQQNASSQR